MSCYPHGSYVLYWEMVDEQLVQTLVEYCRMMNATKARVGPSLIFAYFAILAHVQMMKQKLRAHSVLHGALAGEAILVGKMPASGRPQTMFFKFWIRRLSFRTSMQNLSSIHATYQFLILVRIGVYNCGPFDLRMRLGGAIFFCTCVCRSRLFWIRLSIRHSPSAFTDTFDRVRK